MISGPRRTVKHARQLRREMSWPEILLWSRLRLRPGGFKFRRQHPAGAYVLDFYYDAARLAIELDGIGHDMGDRPMRDDRRDEWLRAQGLNVLRVAATEAADRPDDLVEAIVARCSELGIPRHKPVQPRKLGRRYERAAEAIIALGGSDPEARAAPRRRPPDFINPIDEAP